MTDRRKNLPNPVPEIRSPATDHCGAAGLYNKARATETWTVRRQSMGMARKPRAGAALFIQTNIESPPVHYLYNGICLVNVKLNITEAPVFRQDTE